MGAYVHGSLGTYEEIAYSDFDALVILKDEVCKSSKRLAEVAQKLNRARSIMLDFDPLEHHGWFVLTESDLKFYCNAYFPIELFKYAKSMLNDKGLDLEINLRESCSETREVFEKMADGIIQEVKNRRFPENMFQLKHLMSRFMLLPAFYVQAKTGKGIWKKDSFELARSDFVAADWAIMDEVSEIRMNWSYGLSALKKRLIAHPYILSRSFAKRLAPPIPCVIQDRLTENFFERMHNFCQTCVRRLYEDQVH